MKKQDYIQLCLLVVLAMMPGIASAQLVFSFEVGRHEIDFDDVATNATQLPEHLEAANTFDASIISEMTPSDGTVSNGGIYNIGTLQSPDRAIGLQSRGDTVPAIGYFLFNNTGSVINELRVTYTMEQWRTGDRANIDEVNPFQYRKNTLQLTGGTWTGVDQLNMTEIQIDSTVAVALDGNAAANRKTVSHTITGLNWAANQPLAIRWLETNDTGEDMVMAIDDLIFEALPDVIEVSMVSTEIFTVENSGTVQLQIQAQNLLNSPVNFGLSVVGGNAVEGVDFAFPNGKTITVPAMTITNTTVDIQILDNVAATRSKYAQIRIVEGFGTIVGDVPNAAILIAENEFDPPRDRDNISLSHISSLFTNPGEASSAEIIDYDSATQRLFVSNSTKKTLEIWNLSNIAKPSRLAEIDITALNGQGGDGINGIAVRNGILVAAVAVNDPTGAPTEAGKLLFFDLDGNFKIAITAGVQPDHVSFSPDGRYVLSANEGEPSDDYSIDPEGSVTIVDVSPGLDNISQANATQVDFNFFDPLADNLRSQGIRIFGKNATVSQDLEPEYIAYSANSERAYISCQENNAFVTINIPNKTVVRILPYGYKNHSALIHQIDASDLPSRVSMSTWKVNGMYQPDAIASYEVDGQSLIVTANEGDARDYPGYSEEVRVKDLNLDPSAYPNATLLQADNLLGRLKTTTALGDIDGDGDIDQIYSYGGRSFSIFNAADGAIISDSGDDFEQIIASSAEWRGLFNADNDALTFKARSDDKGPEPEGLTLAHIGDKVYALITLERIGGLMVYDITDPSFIRFEQYINTRSKTTTEDTDLGPEDVVFIPAERSPNDTSLVLISNEVSSSITILSVDGSVATYDPATPSDIAVVIENEGNRINWVDLASNESHYVIERREVATSDFIQVGQVGADVTTFLDTQVERDEQFSYRVKAVNQVGESDYITTDLITTGTGDKLFKINTILYPNPAASHVSLRISLPELGQVDIRILDLSGKEVGQYQAFKQSTEFDCSIDASSLQSGAYLINVQLNGKATNKILIVE